MRYALTNYALNHLWAVRKRDVSGLAASILAVDAAPLADPMALRAQRVEALYAAMSMPARAGGVMVLPIYGSLMYRPDFWFDYFGGCPVTMLQQAFRAALSDESVGTIVFDCDSGGGTTDGVTEFAAEIFRARGTKRIIGQVNTAAHSAAFWLLAQCDEIVISPSAYMGAIGIWTMHESINRMLEEAGIDVTLISAGDNKTMGNPYEPLAADAKVEIQKHVDEMYGTFNADVARGRGVSVADVKANYGQGLIFNAKEAVKIGLADRIGTLDETVGRAAGAKRSARAAVDVPTFVAAVPDVAPAAVEVPAVPEPVVAAAEIVDDTRPAAEIFNLDAIVAEAGTIDPGAADRDSLDLLLAIHGRKADAA